MRISAGVIIVLALASFSRCALAQNANTNWVRITQVRTGLVEDAMAVFTTDALLVNPGKCGTTDSGYQTHPGDAGHKLFQTALLSAYLNGKQVQIVVQGCAYNKPRIIGVFIKD